MKNAGPDFDVRDLDRSVRPQDDFFRYASGGWMEKNPIPKEESRWGSFTMLRKQTDHQLQALVKKVIATKRAKHGGAEQMIRDLYRSGMDLKTRRKRGLTPLSELVERVAGIRTKDDVIKAIAHLERRGVGGVWGTGIDQDEKNSEKYIIYIAQDGLGMPDRDYYLKDDAESKRVRDAYLAYLIRLFELSGRTASAREEADVVLEFETELARVSMKKEDVRDVDKTYHKMSLTKLATLAPGIDWTEYFRILGATPKQIVVMQPKFMAAAARMLRTHPVETWKTYLYANIVYSFSSYLTPELEQASFDFYGTVLTGTKEMRPLWRRVLRVVDGGLSELIGELYVKAHFPKEAKRKIQYIVDDLLVAYEKRIRALDWMSAGTKKKALRKLRAINPKLGYPDKWKTYRGLEIDPGDYAGNLMRLSEYEHRRAMRRLGKPVDKKEWFMSPQTVNAYFSFMLNDITFPAAILQSPFFHKDADDAFNYGAIGSVIGHEITHGFDDQGSKFDERGNHTVWWTPSDRSRFKKKANILVRQFNAYEIEPGMHVNGRLTLGENIADLGGLSIAFDAYQLCLSRTKRSDADGFTPEQRFFLGYAATEREQERPEYRKMQVKSDPHAPSAFRVNGPLSNLPEFYAAFGVQDGDKLYRKPKDRAKIW
ncbi:MAG TPA: M13 family metallopeptidase [Candidatus Paceibacterota bacterium]|nr:M13 family metallopeptidase [Candidatus Paceibacterota bacterium]